MNLQSAYKVLAVVASMVCLPVYAVQTWTNTYNSLGLIETANGPRTDVNDTATFAYDTSGNLISFKNPLDQITLYSSYNGRGLPASVIDINGIETVLTYHPRGWLLSSTVKDPTGNITLDAVTQYQYDAIGQITKITLPDNSFFTYEYDAARRMTAVENALGERIEYTLDKAGNITHEVIKNSNGTIKKTLTRIFDTLSRIKSLIGAAQQTTHFDYDVNNNLTKRTDGKLQGTDQAFDALNRLTTITQPTTSTIGYQYDDQDRLTHVTDQRGLVTQYRYDAFDNLIEQISPDTGTSTFTHDNAGNVLTRTDANNIVTRYQYDVLNRLTGVSIDDDPGATVTYTYDAFATDNYGKGRLTRLTDSTGENNYWYDHRGNVTQHTQIIDGQSYVFSYQYNLADQRVQAIYPDGRTLTYSYNTQGQLIAVSTTKNAVNTALVSGISYLPFGPATAMTYGNGLVYTATYDQDYRVNQLTVGSSGEVQQRVYVYDANNNIAGINDSNDSSQNQRFTYDPVDRLDNASGSYGTRVFQYDGVGNRITLTDNGSDTFYVYDTTSNQLITQGQWNYGYDGNGNLISKTWAANQGTFWTYDGDNRLRRVVLKSLDGQGQVIEQEVARYRYNALGQRVSKTVDGVSTHFVYSLSGQLLAESLGGNAVLSASYSYLNGEPLSYVVGDAVYRVHNDHLGTPKVLTGSTGQPVWRSSALPFGLTTVENDPDGNGEVLGFNLRFPGQYFDGETGTYYNYYRDYDPKLGRYIQSDPVGVLRDYSDPQLELAISHGLLEITGSAGEYLNHNYGYVGQNPLYWIDPWGLAKNKNKGKKPENPNRRKGAEKRGQSGARERNVGHPESEEHSRRPKGGFRGRGIGPVIPIPPGALDGIVLPPPPFPPDVPKEC